MPNDAPALILPLVSVTLPTLLLRLFPGSVRRLELPASTVAELIDALDARWPGMRDRLCDSRPRIRRTSTSSSPASARASRRDSRPGPKSSS
jgi:molybdopterin synthase sulfur carrier subunit